MSTKTPLSDASDTCKLSAVAMSARFAKGDLTPLDATREALARAEAINPKFNAFRVIHGEAALAMAAASTERWKAGRPLSAIDGIPTTLKDAVYVKDWVMRWGSRITPNTPCERDSPAVRRLRDAGAVFLGVTTMPEFGFKVMADSPLTGTTRNPWNPDLSPAGSSSGAAVAAATGAGTLHLGSDGGGSIRMPASMTGVVGLKPTFGRVASYPPSPFGTLSHIGPLTRSVEDAALMIEIMAGRDIDDWLQSPGELPSMALQEGTLKGARVGYWSKSYDGDVHPEVAAAVKQAAHDLEKLGARIEPFTPPPEDLREMFGTLWFALSANRVAAMPPGLVAACDHRFVEDANLGKEISAAKYVEADLRRVKFGIAMDRLLSEFDLVISPTTAVPAFAAEDQMPLELFIERTINSNCFTFPINASQQPAISVPCGMTKDGRPIGLQIIGPRGGEGRVMSAARDYTRAHPWATLAT